MVFDSFNKGNRSVNYIPKFVIENQIRKSDHPSETPYFETSRNFILELVHYTERKCTVLKFNVYLATVWWKRPKIKRERKLNYNHGALDQLNGQ